VEPDRPSGWRLVRFIEHLDRWAELDHPSDDVRLLVSAWVLTKAAGPDRDRS